MVATFGLRPEVFVRPGELALCRKLYLPVRPVMEAQYFRPEAKEVYGLIAEHYRRKAPKPFALFVFRPEQRVVQGYSPAD